MADTALPPSQSFRFLFLYALAAAGGAVAYIPLLTVLLPVRISVLAGNEDVAWLAYISFGGAIAASIANIFFGWLSDVTHDRKGWIVAGLLLSCVLLVLIGQASQFAALAALIIAWQIALNMMLAPLSAWAGDCVPDRQKGFLGGLLAFSPALGALVGLLVTLPGVAHPEIRLWWVAAIVAAMVLPVLLMGRPQPMPALMRPDIQIHWTKNARFKLPSVVASMWLARLLVQVAEATLFVFLFFWFRSISPGFSDSDTAMIFSIALCIAVPLALFAGWWSDRRDRPILPLAATAILAAGGLSVMAMSAGLPGAITGYLLFGIATTIYLSLHSSQTLRFLPRPARRGRDLGVFNLTNTLPSLIMPGLTLALVPAFGFKGLFVLLAGLALIAGLLLLNIARIIRKT